MVAWDEAAVAVAGARMRLASDPRRRRQGGGDRLGSGPGSSLEFHDYRSYVQGDDLRHLDWGVYSRTDQLVLRRHRQEVRPRVEVMLDCSLSMGLAREKMTLAAALADLLMQLAERSGGRPRLWACGEGARDIGAGGARAWRGGLRARDPDGVAGFTSTPPALAPAGERFLIGDGLCPGGGADVVRRLGRGAGRICLVQVLCRAELEPSPLGAVRLEDLEGGALDLIHDQSTCAAYRERFVRHQAQWQAALAGRGAGLVTCLVEDGFVGALPVLLRAGVIEPSTAGGR